MKEELTDLHIEHHANAPEWRDTVAELMKKNEDDFEPSFTERDQSFEQEVNGYVNERKELLKAVKEDKTVGILIFTRGGERKSIKNYCPCLYVNLIIVDKGYRKQGIGSNLYRYLKNEIFPKSKYEAVGVRTWKENKPSQNCIKKA